MTNASLKKVDTLQSFLEHGSIRRFPAKSIIIYAGDNSDTLYYLTQGSINVVIDDDDGQEMIVAYLNEGDFFGEMGLFDESGVRSAWVKAKTACEVAEISYSKFLEISARNPELLFALEAQLARRLRLTTRKTIDLAFLDVTGRIAGTLIDLCKQPGVIALPEGTQLKITRHELALIVSCSREMVGRVLKVLEDRGLISVKGRTILVSNII